MAGPGIVTATRVYPARGVTAEPARGSGIIGVDVPGLTGPRGPGGSVNTVNGRAGDITLSATDVGLGNVSNVAPANLPVSTAQAQADANVQASAATDASAKANAAQAAAISAAALDATAKANAAQSAATAVANAKAAKGDNSDITSLSGLTTPLSTAQGGIGTNDRTVSNLLVLATGSTTARAHAARAADVVNVKDFGAKGDGTTDDAAAINAALAYVRTMRNGAQTRVVFPHGTYLVKSTVNMTGLKSKSIIMECSGAIVFGQIAGKPVIDALSTEYLTIRDIAIAGDATVTPSVGLRIGRAGTTNTENADNIYLDCPRVYGSFTLAAVHNLNSETTTFIRPMLTNAYNSASSYTLIMDGLNHFNAQSDFVTVTAPVDTPQSFNENLILNADIRHNGPGVPVWLGQTTRHRWVSGYIAAVQGTVGAILYSVASTDANSYLDFDTHVETSTVQNTFLLSGPNATPALPGFKFRDQYPSGSNSLFKLDTGITAVTMHGCDLEIGGMPSGSKVFDLSTAWTVTGRVLLGNFGNVANFNYTDGKFAGQINTNGSLIFVSNSTCSFGPGVNNAQINFGSGRAVFGYDTNTNTGDAVVNGGSGKGVTIYAGGTNGVIKSGAVAFHADINGLAYTSGAVNVSAAGTTLATATPLTKNTSIVTTVASGSGVVLSPWGGSAYNATVTKQEVFNSGANALLVYPPTSTAVIINGQTQGAAGAAVSLAVGAHATFTMTDANTVRQSA